MRAQIAPRATLQRVAETARVSVSTVDRVINRRGGVSREMEQRVLVAARTLQLDRMLYRVPTRTVRVAFVLGAESDEFFRKLGNAIRENSRNFGDLNIQCVIIYCAQYNFRATLDRLKDVENIFDMLVVTVVASATVARRLQAIADRIPVVTMCNDIPDSGRIAYFGIDETRAGRIAGELMGRFLPASEQKILFVYGFDDELNQIERQNGFLEVLGERFPNCHVVASRQSHADAALAGQIVRREWSRHRGLDGIYNVSNGSGTICGLLPQFGPKIVYITHETTEKRLSLLRSGHIDAIINQNLASIVISVLNFISDYFDRSPQMKIAQSEPIEILLRESAT